MIKIPDFTTKQEGIEWVMTNKDLIIREKTNSIKHSDYYDAVIDDLNAEKGMIANSSKKLECLIYEGLVRKSRNEFMYEQYKNNRVLNHSVGMRYIKYVLCVDSDDPAYTAEKENWDKYYPFVINKEAADSRNWFWAVTESKNIEGSAVVRGSNFLTPTLSVTQMGDDTLLVKAIINVCGIIDSHMDVHIPGCWNKTINENQYELLLKEHEMEFDCIIADSMNDELKVYVESISITQLNSRFKAMKNIEPDSSTQNKGSRESTSERKQSFLNPFNLQKK